MTQKPLKVPAHRTDYITGQQSAVSFPQYIQEIKRSVKIMILAWIHRKEQLKVALPWDVQDTITLIHSNHIHNSRPGFPHCKARRVFEDLWEGLYLLIYQVWRATKVTPVEENKLLTFPPALSTFCKIQRICLDVTDTLIKVPWSINQKTQSCLRLFTTDATLFIYFCSCSS